MAQWVEFHSIKSLESTRNSPSKANDDSEEGHQSLLEGSERFDSHMGTGEGSRMQFLSP